MVVIRSMELTQKKTTMTFKQLDGILRTVDPTTGQRVSLSHKCTELDRQIPNLMGVSKPILEHVVFCHQEDSSWPLQEGAVLKKRFDDIFDSTKYAKALEAIKASRKDYASQVKDLKAELEGLKSHKHAANGFRNELEKCQDEISGVDDQINECVKIIAEEDAIIAEKRKILLDIQAFEAKLDDKSFELSREDAVLEKQKELLGDDVMEDKTTDELKEMLRELDDKQGYQSARALQEKELQIQRIGRNLEVIRRAANDLNTRRGKLEAAKEAHAEVLRQRFKIMEQIHKKHQIDLMTQSQDVESHAMTQGTTATSMTLSTIFTSSSINGDDGTNISDEDVDAFLRALRHKETTLKNEWDNAKRKHQTDEDDLQSEISELQAQKSAVENDRRRTEMTKNEAMRELSMVSGQMSSSLTRVRKSDVDEAKRHAAQLAATRDELNNNPRREDIAKEIRVQEEKLKSISATVEQDTKIRDQLRLQSEQQNEIVMLEGQVTQEFEVLEEKIKDNSFLLSSHGEAHVRVTKEDPVSPLDILSNNVRRKHLDAEDEVSRSNTDLSRIQIQLSEKKALITSHMQRLQNLQYRANQLNREGGGVQKIGSIIRAIIRQDDNPSPQLIHANAKPQDVLAYLTDQINECNAMDDKPEQVKRIIKRLKKMVKTSAACPCCTREFQNEQELDVFFNRMNELGDEDVSELMTSQKSQQIAPMLQKYETWRKSVSEHMNEHLEYTRLLADTTEVEQLIEKDGNSEVKDLEAELQSAQSKVNEKKEVASELQQLLTAVNGIQDVAKRMWEKMCQVKEKRERLKYMFCGDLGDDRRDLKTVERDLQKSADAKEQAYYQINKLNNELKSFNEKISRVTNQASTAERTAREKEDTYNRDQAASKRKDELNAQLEKLSEEDRALEKKIVPIRHELMRKESDRQSLREQNNMAEAVLSDAMNGFDRDVAKLQEIIEKVNYYIKQNTDKEIEDVEQKLAENVEEIRNEETMLANLKPEIEHLKRQVNEGERQKKVIQDNLSLIKLSEEVQKMEEDVRRLDDELNAMGRDDAQKALDESRRRRDEEQEKRARCEGRKQGLSDQKRTLKKKLNEQEYKDIDERHRVKMIEHETTQIVVSDLDKYYDALDKALLRYHGLKISDINRIIAELWSLTYKGEDITNIEIVSGQESGSRANRSYNYRIVMSKGGTKMDMRGRCSAGQRVLASIVIRLALAETFCLNCGVMALDEPTTNLDYENKRGLAIALAQIIASRAAQSNFQLVVITHDEDFVSMMKQELSAQTGFNMPERYYQVSREEGHDGRFYSKIHAIDWDEL